MAGKLLNIKVRKTLKQHNGLTGKHHAICHYSYNLPFSPMLKSILLTAIQFLMLGIILYSNSWFVHQPFLLGIQLLGLFIGIWSIAEMSKSKLNIAPMIRHGAILISSGPYRIVRHPMYLTLLLFLLPILIINSNIANWIAFSILLINMLLKLLYEEKLLTERFEGYSAYKQKTWRLIPFVY